MKNGIQKALLAGILGTGIMSGVMMLVGIMGMPKMSPPEILSVILGVPEIVGWVMHFGVGISFAVIYLFLPLDKINNTCLKGIAFGIFAFIMAQVSIGVMETIFNPVEIEGPIVLMAIKSVVGHIIFRIVVALVIGNTIAAEL